MNSVINSLFKNPNMSMYESIPFRDTGGINSDRFATKLRNILVDLENKSVLLARLDGTLQSQDNYTKANCLGLGRTRIFTNYGMHLSNVRTIGGHPIPFLRGHPPTTKLRSQVFQLAGCNLRCWYCYVDDKLLSARPLNGEYVSASDIVDMYLNVPNRPIVIDLSGGQPDLVPEWTFWVLEELDRRGLRGNVLVWQDDNLSTELVWDVLTVSQIEFMASFDGHSRVGCFKGFDPVSFAYNTSATIDLFDRQFIVFERLLKSGFDLYAYATFTSPPDHCTKDHIKCFMDRLQAIHPLLPLRTIPLRVRKFNATTDRMNEKHERAFDEQHRAGYYWDSLLSERFTREELECPYEKIKIR